MSRFTLKAALVAACCCWMSTCSQAFAASIGVNFVGNGSAIGSSQGFGFVGQINWNNAVGASGSMAALSETGGGSASVSWLSAFTGVGSIPFTNRDPGSNIGACNLCSGPQDGWVQVMDGTIHAQNSLGSAGQQVELTFTGLSSVFADYDVFVYFNATNDQGDQYEARFDDGVHPVIFKYPASPLPAPNSAGRSAGEWYGYDDNGDLIGNSFSGFGDNAEDSMVTSSSGYLIQGMGDLSGDTLHVRISDLNDNGNNGTPTQLGGPNWGPDADLGVAAIQIVGNPVPEPSAVVLLAIGFVVVGCFRRKYHRGSTRNS